IAQKHGKPPAKRTRFNYEDTIKVVVGEGEAERTFTMHKDKICARSPFLQAACLTRHRMGLDNFIFLEEQEPELFELYVNWVYTGQVDASILSQPQAQPDNNDKRPTYLQLGKVWALGYYLQDTKLRNKIVDMVITMVNKTPGIISAPVLRLVWRGVPEGSTLRRLYTQIEVCHASSSDFKNNIDAWPVEVLEEATMRFCAREVQDAASVPKWWDRCTYHEHEVGDPKCP
ncbi:hypothetical protein CLAFUR4_14529, partial [Fulvia fulva]